MSLWLLLALMTAAAVFAVLLPLGRRAQGAIEGCETVVYKDQLAEIERDRSAGLIGISEAEAARTEIGRRLIAAADVESQIIATTNFTLHRVISVVALVGLPCLAAMIYLMLGSPQLPDFPLAERPRQSAGTDSLDNLVAQVQSHLEKNPEDGRGWQVLAPVLMKIGRFDEAVQAFRRSMSLNGESADNHADLGEALTAAANGVVTAEAKIEFERAVALSVGEVKARYFLGLAAEQDGRAEQAAAMWRELLVNAPPEAAWRPLVQASLARVGGAVAPALSDRDIAAAKGMGAGDQETMIHSMVERLAGRLKQNGHDVDGWLRLARAYIVLGDADKAKAAQVEARAIFSDDIDRLKQLNEGFKSLGLDK
jgi:cytochrome c-type biogenesis protein CcmH